jgi:hypothetical protein
VSASQGYAGVENKVLKESLVILWLDGTVPTPAPRVWWRDGVAMLLDPQLSRLNADWFLARGLCLYEVYGFLNILLRSRVIDSLF